MSNSFWEFLWLIISTFFLFAYLIVLFQIIVDLFRDRELGGFAKALWIIALIVLPLITALVYIVFRGSGMGQRELAARREMQAETESYIRSVAGGTSPSDEIARAQALLRDGTITDQEFAAIKAKALA